MQEEINTTTENQEIITDVLNNIVNRISEEPEEVKTVLAPVHEAAPVIASVQEEPPTLASMTHESHTSQKQIDKQPTDIIDEDQEHVKETKPKSVLSEEEKKERAKERAVIRKQYKDAAYAAGITPIATKSLSDEVVIQLTKDIINAAPTKKKSKA